ncbi:MAG: hypothetical protein AAGL24_19430 [Pseudomonadota bacterium]
MENSRVFGAKAAGGGPVKKRFRPAEDSQTGYPGTQLQRKMAQPVHLHNP